MSPSYADALSFGCGTLKAGPKGIVVEVTDGDTVLLDDGSKIRLIGMQAPKLPLGRVGYKKWPFGDEAKAFLEEFSLGREVRIYYGKTRMDRHGRVLGHMFVENDPQKWAQKAVLAAGLARVYSFPDNRHCLDELLAEERKARANGLGIWDGEAFYRIRSAQKVEKLARREGHYELVEGRVESVGETKYKIYLNFGKNWKTDFTAVIDRRFIKNFKQSDIDLKQLEHKLVRVRGWLDINDGPRIDVTHPEQIEILAAQ